VHPSLVTAFPTESLASDLSAHGSDQGAAPPDTQLAAGPTDLVSAVNSSMWTWTKQGVARGSVDLNAFFPLPNGYSFTDPRVVYDALTSRWFVSGLAFDSANDSQVYVAVSQTSDPTGLYSAYLVSNEAGVVQDQPKVGLDSSVVVLSWNDYTGGSSFSGAETKVLEKADLLAHAVTVRTVSFGPDTTRFGIVPVQSLTATTTEYLVYNDSCGATTSCTSTTSTPALGRVAITGTPAASTVAWAETDPAIVPTAGPPPADQPGHAASVETNDDRFLTAIADGSDIYLSGNDGCIPTGDTVTRPCARLIEVTVAATPTVTLDSDLAYSGADLYFPAAAPDAGGNVFVSATYSSTTTDPAAIGLALASGASSFSAVIFQAGSGVNTDVNGRWGDYSGIAVDPSNPTDVWLAAEYAPSSDQNWGTAIGELSLAPHLSVSAPSGATTGSLITVTVTARDGSGAINPGYTGTVHLTSSDGAASLPADYTFQAGDAGAHQLAVILRTPGTQTVTATDTVTPTTTGTSATIAVTAPPPPPPFSPQGVGQPTVAIDPSGAQLIFWQGAGGHLMEAWWNGSWNGPVDWTAANGWAPRLTSAPSVALAPDGTQIIFWQGAGQHLFEAWWKGAWNGPVDWTAANRWAASVSSAPSVTFNSAGAQLIFWQGAGGHLDEAWWNGAWNGPVDWTAANGWPASVSSAPTVRMTADGTQTIFWEAGGGFGRVGGGHLDEVWWNGSWNGPVDWTAANRWAATMTSAPSVVFSGSTQLIFWQGTGGHLIEVWWNGSWNGPVDWSG
jgi:hypothetical protein